VSVLAGVRIALRALRINKLRSTLAILGIVMGVADVIATVAIGAGAAARVTAQIENLGSNLIIVLSGTVTTGGARLGQGTQLTITEQDALAIQRDLTTVALAAPFVRGPAQVVYGNLNWATFVLGVTPEYFTARQWQVASGRPIAGYDLDHGCKVALLGQTVAQALFGAADPIGQEIRVRRVPLTVIGVLERKGQNTQGQDQDDVIFLPLSTGKTKVIGTSRVNAQSVGAILVKVNNAAAMDRADAQIRALLRQRHRLQPDQEDDFRLRNLSEVLLVRDEYTRILTLLLTALASVALLVGGIGIMNIMLVSVTERTREIGLRIAVGARGRDIMLQFLVEALTLALLGGLLGIVIGILGSRLISTYFGQFPAIVDTQTVAIGFSFAVGIGLFFGFYPARRAALLSPIDALRYE
jgi:putative ABC transport system permease protein